MPTAPMLPDGLRIYAVGDVHGRFDLLQALAAEIEADLRRSPSLRAIVIFLGDYIDRGPQSRDVLDWLMDSPPIGEARICLLGNHEDMLLNALADASELPVWLFNGGQATLESYVPDIAESRQDLHATLLTAIPMRHQAFLSSLPRSVEFGSYLFVHAGINPQRPLDDQDPNDLVWIREPFLHSGADFGRIVVHGHTPTAAPDFHANRINIDTGAVFTGCLTCLVLEGKTMRVLQALGEN